MEEEEAAAAALEEEEEAAAAASREEEAAAAPIEPRRGGQRACKQTYHPGDLHEDKGQPGWRALLGKDARRTRNGNLTWNDRRS